MCESKSPAGKTWSNTDPGRDTDWNMYSDTDTDTEVPLALRKTESGPLVFKKMKMKTSPSLQINRGEKPSPGED